ncbi:tubulin epsilon and delta complex protein 2 isoform X2 [Hippopotamus amphibius kiboko]|uniref:tubulin epsilon and delta complex protein 2 isoform X2 n=1 Tax=Hippopotamus amphibius kiboko TaxID=575201 RepID=UPI0025995BB8|nr:tubulin epsilon and delta complex protein 2 isoform X2 [Hippopotamus amphibius kiboko]
MLPAGSVRRLAAELWDALDSCAEQQRQLERSLRVSRRLLRAWEPAETPASEPTPGPGANEEAPSAACTPSPQDLKELELLTQALEKAVRVRKGISKAGEGDKAPILKPGSIATSPATRASARLSTSRGAGSHAAETKPPRGMRYTRVPAKDLPQRRLLSVGDGACMGKGATKPEPGLRDQQIVPSAASRAPEAFTLKDKGILLQLPEVFRKAASRNSCLWAQLSSTQTSDSVDAATTAKTQFLQKMQTTVSLRGLGGWRTEVLALNLVSLRRSNSRESHCRTQPLGKAEGPGYRGISLTCMQSGWPGSRLSVAEVEVEVGRLQKACSLLRLRMGEELTADPKDWMQEYRCLLTLEGLQAIVGQYLHRLQDLRTVVEQQLGPWPEGRLPRASSPCAGGADPIWSPQLLLYSSTQELKTLAALRLRVAMLHQQIHLEKVLMGELLPLVSKQEPLGPPWLALCRAVYSLLCEGGQRFLTILREEEPAN